MLIEVDSLDYNKLFNKSSNPFIEEQFISINAFKVDKVVRLIERNKKASLGLVAGIKDKSLRSPFSAPFGGFHFSKEELYISEIDSFFESLKSYVSENGIKNVLITLPPDIYHASINSKFINSFLRANFLMEIPEITSIIKLKHLIKKTYPYCARNNYRQASEYGLTFHKITSIQERKLAFELIRVNRLKKNRQIFMSFSDLEATSQIWPIDYFSINDNYGKMVASSILYRFHPEIIYLVFWGDNEFGRPYRAMDFLVNNLWRYYLESGFKYIDLSTSSEAGIPNEGLLRFKEMHYAISALKFSFTL